MLPRTCPATLIVLCGFRQSFKISQGRVRALVRAAAAVPQAVLWLLEWNANVRESLLAAAAARHRPERLRFAPLLPLSSTSRAGLRRCLLDAWPCNAHTTAGEASVDGRAGGDAGRRDTFAQRVGASLLHQVGMDELVCASTKPATSRSVAALAADARAPLAALNAWNASATSPLFDGERFAATSKR